MTRFQSNILAVFTFPLAVSICLTAASAAPFILQRTLDDPTVTRGDQFGKSVALDGNRALVGVPSHEGTNGIPGQAHLFDVTTGSLQQTFDDPTITLGDQFGWSVALDGNLALVGARRDDTQGTDVGQAHLFDTTTGNLLQTLDDPTITTSDRFGQAVALDGTLALVGAPFHDTTNGNVGQAHLFDVTTGDLLQTFNDPTVTGGDNFGHSLALDGDRALIGAFRDDTNGFRVGQAYLFDVTTGDLLQTFDDPTVTNSDNFGFDVALDGDRALVGARRDDTLGTDVGQAHLFDATTGDLLQTLDDPTVTSRDRFGWSVALDGNFALVGARDDNSHGTDVGQAHLFDATTGELLQTLDDPTVTSRDRFGSDVALDGNRALIGARFDDTIAGEVGQAHLFEATLPQRLDVTYSLPEVIEGPISGGLDELPDEVHAQFILEGIGTTPGSTAELANVRSASVPFGDGEWTENELNSFELAIGDGGEIVTLNWAMDAIETAAVLDDIILNNNFELTITGTDRASGEPFEYSYPMSTQMLTQVPEPASLVLCALGGLVLLRLRFERRNWLRL